MKRIMPRAKGRADRILKAPATSLWLCPIAETLETSNGQKVHPNGIRLGIVKPWNSTCLRTPKNSLTTWTAILKYVSPD